MDEQQLPEHVARNREAWDAMAADYAEPGRRNWALDEPRWGIWGIPEADLHLLPDTLEGKDVIELGCGTAYVSAWMARRGARVIGIDNSPAQLATARRLQAEFNLEFPLLLGNAESVPLPAASFDVAISEYGAALWADPYRWIPEASRLLRPGGELIFLTNATLLMLCVPDEDDRQAEDRLLRDSFGMYRFEWPGDPAVEFHLTHADWIGLLRANNFEITELIEPRPSESASTRYPFVSVEWARRWPTEEAWKARKRKRPSRLRHKPPASIGP